MLKHVTFLGATAVAACLFSAAAAQDVTADTVVATVGETEITLGEVIIAREALPRRYGELEDSLLFNGLVDQLVQQQLLADVAEEVSPRIKYTISNEERALIAAGVVENIASEAITEADIEAAYEEEIAGSDGIPEFRASHLLTETEEEAVAAKERIDAGEAFADVARDVSTGPTGPNGGDLGWFGEGAMVAEFQDQITSLEVGEVSDAFQTQFGWHVATLQEKRFQPVPSLEELRDALAGTLQERFVRARLEELAAAETVVMPEEGQFDPSLINRVDLLD